MPSQKHVLLARGGGASLLQEGVVADISRDGLGIVTSPTLPIGSSLEIEFTQAAHNNEPLFVRGRVVHVEALPDSTYAIGVETLLNPNVKSVAPHANPNSAQPTPNRDTVMTHDSSGHSTSVQSANSKKRETDKRKQLIPIVLVLLIPLATGWSISRHADGGNNTTNDNIQVRLPSENDEPVPLPDKPPKKKKSVKEQPPREASASRNSGGAAGGSPSAPRSRPPVSGDIGDAALVRDNSVSIRQRLANLAVSTTKQNIEPEGGVGSESPTSPLQGREQQGKPTEPPATLPKSGIALVIDKSSFSMTLYRNGQPIRTIPVAVGAEDTTPTGVFTVVNKLTDPVWHNRGEGVPPGDPRNPLGKRWLGLARDGRPTTYGIHAALDTSRVGKPFGDGCLRLHPEDLETVFRICPVGATVMIQP
ncbi:MAG: L,D-transpeptidase family protein [Candidatus Hydrogenedentes bacterium]|nr:L,D-transpeptidase family protein [Candidatus Hydrogenedentota bacterium]